MDFWSKGLGKRTIELRLSNGEATKSGSLLYVKGNLEEPIAWDYIMPLAGNDLAEFLGLLREPQVAEFLYRSPDRRRVYTGLVLGGVRLAVLLVAQVFRGLLGPPPPEEPTIQIPPPRQRRRRTGKRTGERSRRRLGSRSEKSEQSDLDAERSSTQQVG